MSQIEMLERRQRELLLRSAALRDGFALHAQVLRPPLALADRVREAWLWLRTHPEVPLTALALTAVLRPRRVWRWGLRLWWGWRAFRRLRARIDTLR